MKILGKRILNSNFRFTFNVEGDTVSTYDAMNIKQLDEAVCDTPNGNTTSLSDVVFLLNQIDGGDVTVALERIEDEG